MLILACALAVDVTRPPARQRVAHIVIGGIHVYQRVFSPGLHALGVRCRFEPTCSRYAEASLARNGLLAGGAQAVRRLLRCGPWTPAGTFDPPR